MLLLDSVSKIKDDRIEIPLYHRGHLSLMSGTKVTVCLIPESASTPDRLTEMIVSPIEFRAWRRLWRINAVFLEQQGIVHKLLSILRDHNLNVLFEESSSVESRGLHEVELVVDTSAAYPKFISEEEDYQRAKALERRVATLCVSELALAHGKLRVKVRRMKGLYRAWEKFQEYVLDSQASVQNPRLHERSLMKGGDLLLPDQILKYLSAQKPLKPLIISDTKERLLRLFFVNREECMTYLRVRHIDSIGALEKITGALAKSFDIVTSLTRLRAQGDTSFLELMLASRHLSGSSQEDLRRKIVGNLLSGPEFDALDLRLSYPRRAASFLGSKSEKKPKMVIGLEFPTMSNLPAVPDSLLNRSTAGAARAEMARLYELADQAKDYELSKDYRSRVSVLSSVLELEGDSAPPLVGIFVSFMFSRSELFEVAREPLRDAGCVAHTGQDPDEKNVFRQVIIDRVRNSQGFLGIWTPREDGQISPWLLWELGVAQAFGLPYRLLIDTQINPDLWRPINPEQQQEVYQEVDFKEKATKAVALLLNEIGTRKRKHWI